MDWYNNIFSICRGTLTVCNLNLDYIQERINNGDTPKEALQNELSF